MSEKTISVIGARAFPANFVGTSGIEFYLQNIIDKIDNNFIFYTKRKYQNIADYNDHKIVAIPTLGGKFLESLSYSLISSFKAALSSSETIWFHGVGMAIFSFIPSIFAKKIVLTVHSLDWERDKWSFLEKKLFYFLSKIIFRKKIKVYAVSQKIVDQLKFEFKISAKLATPGFFDFKNEKESFFIKEFSFLKKGEYLLFLGRIVPEKKLELLIKSFLKLPEKQSLKLVIAGHHGNMPSYEKELKEKYSSKRVVFIDSVFGDRKVALLRNAKLFISTSNLEGNSIALLEALSLKTNSLVRGINIPQSLKKFPIIYSFENDLMFTPALEKLLKNDIKKVSNKDLNKFKKTYSWFKTAKLYENYFSIS